MFCHRASDRISDRFVVLTTRGKVKIGLPTTDRRKQADFGSGALSLHFLNKSSVLWPALIVHRGYNAQDCEIGIGLIAHESDRLAGCGSDPAKVRTD